MKTLALVMIVKNEERCLERCLECVKGLVDDIYITDTGSTDRTVEIAKKFGAHVSRFDWCGDFSAARNFSLQQSGCDWNLILDADEYLVSGTREDIREFMEKGNAAGAIHRLDSFVGDSGEVCRGNTFTTRLVPSGSIYKGRVHEQVVSDLPVRPVPLVFEHDGYMQGGKGERNLQILMEDYEEAPEDSYVLYQIAYTLWNMKRYEEADPWFEKFYKLVPKSGTGYRPAGVVAYLYNLLQLKRYEEGLAMIDREKEKMDLYADFHFACGTFYTQAIFSDVQRYVSLLPEIEKSYLKCLEVGEVPEQGGVWGNGSFKAAYNLGVWCEVNGNQQKALAWYRQALDQGYTPAGERIEKILQKN